MIRSMLFPIFRNEIFRFLLTTALMACCLFAYTTVRIIKDTAFVNAPGSSAQAISFVKTLVVVPSSVVFVLCYSKIAKLLSRRNAFVSLLGFFAVFFFVYAHFLYPYRSYIQASPEYIEHLQQTMPKMFKQMIAIYGNWSTVLFYTVADISGNTLLTFAFWQFANQITRPEDSKRIYGMYGMYGNITGIVMAGYSGKILDRLITSAETLLRVRLTIVSSVLFLGIAIYLYMYHFILTEEEREHVPTKKAKPKLSLWESFKLVFCSRYLLCIMVMVLAYGMCINLVEVTWKTCVKMRFPNEKEFMAFFDNLYVMMGLLTFFVGILGQGVSRMLGWLASSLSTPVVMIATIVPFFGFILYDYTGFVSNQWAPALEKGLRIFELDLSTIGHLLTTDSVFIAIVLGTLQNLFGKSVKYVLFDPATNMAYIVLDDNLKTNGKAAVDIIVGRFGKSGGAAIQVFLTMATGWTQMELAPILAVIVGAILVCWIIAVVSLNTQYNALLAQQEVESK